MGAAEYTPKIELAVVQEPGADPHLAGDTVEYFIKYRYLAPDNGNETYGWNGSDPMVDWYGKDSTGVETTNKLTFTLPAGLLLTQFGSKLWPDIPVEPNDRDLSKAHTYTIDLVPVTGADHQYFETLKIYIGNNGTRGSVNTYPFENDAFKFTTTFEVVDPIRSRPTRRISGLP